LKTHYSLAVVKGLDLSPDALAVASKNGSNLGLQIEWIKGDMQDDGILEGEERFDLIVSNPPYVLRSEREKMARHVTEFEPRPALFVSDTDPLVHFRAIARISQRLLKEQGVVWVEVNERFGNETARIFINSGFGQTAIIKDIHEKERFIRACR
jgi:release factor glutamine methyltransferase